MTLTIQLSPEAGKQLRELADRAGKSVEEYIEELVEAKARAVNGCQKNPVTLQAGKKDAHVADMSPVQRATYERITALREKIGAIDFDFAKALAELRENG